MRTEFNQVTKPKIKNSIPIIMIDLLLFLEGTAINFFNFNNISLLLKRLRFSCSKLLVIYANYKKKKLLKVIY